MKPYTYTIDDMYRGGGGGSEELVVRDVKV